MTDFRDIDVTRKVKKTQAALKREDEQFSIGKTKEDVKALKSLLVEHDELKDHGQARS